MAALKNTQPGKIRIIGGTHRRQMIPVIAHQGLRPSADRVRETVFNWMNHQWGGVFADKAILDAFTGSGAFGLECISRGATDVLMVDNHAAAITQIQQILKNWGVQTNGGATQADVLSLCPALIAQGKTFDWIVLDPPFERDMLAAIAPYLNQLTHADSWLYVEVEAKMNLDALAALGWTQIKEGRTQQVAYGLWRKAT
jgi:16S rRNA (guanine(966)-N(2))-methyltransferase RsmD